MAQTSRASTDDSRPAGNTRWRATLSDRYAIITGVVVLVALGAFAPRPAASDDSEPDGGSSADTVARELANPNTSLGFLAFQLDYVNYEGDVRGADSQDAWRINFQPSLPYPIGGGANLFLRPLIPVILEQPVPTAAGFSHEGVDLGDIGFDLAVGKGFSNGVQVIGGMVGTLPTATEDALGRDQLLLGPEGFIGHKTSWGFYGALVSHSWDVAGDDRPSTSITAGQYFYTINLPDAWQIQAQPTWSYDHKAPSDNKLTLPLGTGVSKTVVLGGTPLKFSLQYWYYVVSPDLFGPQHQVRLQVAPVVPLPW